MLYACQGTTTLTQKNQSLNDVTDIIQEWTQRGFHPIVAGDFNSEPSDPAMVRFIERNGLVDLVMNSASFSGHATADQNALT